MTSNTERTLAIVQFVVAVALAIALLVVWLQR